MSIKLIKLLVLFAGLALGQTDMVHGDLAGTGANTAETILTPANILAANFGLLGTYRCGDGTAFEFAQPVITTTNKLIVATLDNHVCLFDAGKISSLVTPTWSTFLGTPNSSYQGFGVANQWYQKPIGIISTPYVDETAAIIYVCWWNSSAVWTLTALNIADGSIASNTTISGTVVGTGDVGQGDNTSGANLLFYSAKELNRPGLKKSGKYLYVAFGGVGDQRPWHGWIMAYDTTNAMSQAGVFCVTPNTYGGSIWGGEPTFDASGHVYITTGNGGTYNTGNGTYTDSVIALSATLSLLGTWTPSNQATINAADADTSSNRVIVIPGTNLLAATAAKDFNVYLLDAICLQNAANSSTTCQNQTFKTNASGTTTDTSGAYAVMFMNNVFFVPAGTGESANTGDLYSFTFGGSTFTTTPLAHVSPAYGYPYMAALTGSSNGATNQILWVVTTPLDAFSTVQAGTLRALNATTLAEIWNSGSTLGNISKFAAPTIYNGKIYVATQSGYVAVYGFRQQGVVGNSTFNSVALN